ncbi:hypothetical protein NsoK4_07690 [Nitrosopumilus sp. K4]|uniref:hypothetical protein n=1 Tax=Nitrosopumilus sp. K4 TaxID=2795383 RepID=UPI001BAB76F8|nr:hypothetical protein [Nitrosopumilus sp. K4]QUC64303.1 hypothetical protein NsoK4_07690 [Nitrosopumilus sp. K4]
MKTKFGTFFLFTILIFGMASFPTNIHSESTESITFDPIFLNAFAEIHDDDDERDDDERDDDERDDDERDDDERDDDERDDDERDDDERDDDESDAREEIEDAREEIQKAEDKISDVTDDDKDTSVSLDKLSAAKELLVKAESSFDNGNFDEAEDYAEDAKKLASESRMKFLGKTFDDVDDDNDNKESKRAEKLAEKESKRAEKLAEREAREAEKLAEREAKLTEKAQFSEERANQIIEKLEKRIQQLEQRLQKLIDKYESGEYFGNLKNKDTIIKSFTLSIGGTASEISDSSNLQSFTGSLFLENQVTGNNAKKFRVTGGELFVGESEVYDIMFGKARLSSSGPGGEKDSMVVIAQTSNGVDIRTLKLSINLSESFNSETESSDIEILSPQSKIASEWFLGGSGTLGLTEILDSDTSDDAVEIPDTDIPITTSISISTPTDIYFRGNEIVISGSVMDIFEDTPVIIQTITGSDLIDIAQILVDTNGEFTHTILADGPLWVSGTYTIKAFYGANNVAETTFDFIAE